MGTLIPDPELEKLVREMNRPDSAGDDSPVADWDGPDLRDVRDDEPLDRMLAEVVRREASDLLLVPGSSPVIRVNGRLESIPLPAIGQEVVGELFAPHLGARARAQLRQRGSTDFSLRLSDSGDGAGWRFRVNLQRQGGRLAAAVRVLPRRIPSLDELHLPSTLGDLAGAASGLVLVCGPTGSGKTTTLASILDRLNREQLRHVITIEEPVEYEHSNRRSVFEQVEIGSDAPEFATALRSALRRDPDVLLVGEMRDLETMSTALTAAETGHLVFSTMHTGNSAQAVHRVVDVFPTGRQEQIRHQLALSLRAVVCQQLVPTPDGRSRLPAVEILLATHAVRNHIRRGNVDRLYNELIGGRALGMQSMEQALADLVRSGAIAADEATARAGRPDELARLLP